MIHLKALALIAIVLVLAQKSYAKDKKANEKYLSGYYADNQGHRIQGLIAKDDLNWKSFNFKKQLGDTPINIDAAQCDSFSVNNRTFYSIPNIQLKAIVWRTNEDRAFAELVANGPVQLYCIHFEPAKQGYMKAISIASNFTGGIAGQVVGNLAGRENVNYFLHRRGSDSFVRIAKKTFTEDMAGYFKDDAVISQKIGQNADYCITNIELIVKEYNQDYVVSHLNTMTCVAF